jgi:hypothetical protein
MDVDVNGNSNTAYVDQKSDGDKMLFLDVNGSSNTIDILQQGTGQHFLDVTLGSNQTRGHHPGWIWQSQGHREYERIHIWIEPDHSRAPSDQNYYLYQNCTNANGCGTTTVNQN